MNDLELTTLLDAHDSLVKSCVGSTLPFEEFLALYNDFPHVYALGGLKATPEERAVLKRSERRIAFHFQIAAVLTGLYSAPDSVNSPYPEAGRFASEVGLMRLRALIARHPDFEGDPSSGERS